MLNPMKHVLEEYHMLLKMAIDSATLDMQRLRSKFPMYLLLIT
jgi:hypothetical protein